MPGSHGDAVRSVPRDVPWGYPAVVAGVIGSIFAGQIGLLVAALIHGSAITSAAGPLWGLALSSLFLQLVTGGVPLFVAASGPRAPSPRSDLGGRGPVAGRPALSFQRARDALGLSIAWIDLPIGIAVGVFAQLVLVWLLYAPLSRWITPDDLEGPARQLGDLVHNPADRVLLVLMVCVGAPISEELMYRGLLLRALHRRLGRRPAVVISAGVFALVHFQGVQLPGLLLIGLILASLVMWTDRLGTSMVAHAAFNAVTVIQLLAR